MSRDRIDNPGIAKEDAVAQYATVAALFDALEAEKAKRAAAAAPAPAAPAAK